MMLMLWFDQEKDVWKITLMSKQGKSGRECKCVNRIVGSGSFWNHYGNLTFQNFEKYET